jgi:hypothetical protein
MYIRVRTIVLRQQRERYYVYTCKDYCTKPAKRAILCIYVLGLLTLPLFLRLCDLIFEFFRLPTV